jgi:hypothetical protein
MPTVTVSRDSRARASIGRTIQWCKEVQRRDLVLIQAGEPFAGLDLG